MAWEYSHMMKGRSSSVVSAQASSRSSGGYIVDTMSEAALPRLTDSRVCRPAPTRASSRPRSGGAASDRRSVSSRRARHGWGRSPTRCRGTR